MTTDPFTDAARAEAPEPCEHHWVSHGQDSALIPWVVQCDLCGAFDMIREYESLARTHLAAQEPTDAEVDAGMTAAAQSMPAEWWGGTEWRRYVEEILSAARAARRDEEKR